MRICIKIGCDEVRNILLDKQNNKKKTRFDPFLKIIISATQLVWKLRPFLPAICLKSEPLETICQWEVCSAQSRDGFLGMRVPSEPRCDTFMRPLIYLVCNSKSIHNISLIYHTGTSNDENEVNNNKKPIKTPKDRESEIF